MTLFEKIKDIVPLGFDVKFSKDINHLKIKVSHLEGMGCQMLPLSDHFTEDRVIGCIDLLVEKIIKDGKLNLHKKLAMELTKIVTLSEEKNKLYIEFLSKHKLPNSGPTPELLESLNKEQREELKKIIMQK